MSFLLTCCLLLGPCVTTPLVAGTAAGTARPQPQSQEAQDPVDQAAREAIDSVPRRRKVGKVRGLRTRSEVRFLSAPDAPYSLQGSFSVPQRSRVILSNEDGSFERYQLGPRLFGLDLAKGTAPETTPSYLLQGAGYVETLLDLELRRALFFWPDHPKFTGSGRTFTAKIGSQGVLLATVDEATGRPTSIQALGASGKPAAEFHTIAWSAAESPNSRRWPASFTFAAGGQDLWRETVESCDPAWLFSDLWFLPKDRITAVLGSELAGQLQLRALSSAWIYRIEFDRLRAEGEEGGSPSLRQAVDRAASHWHEVRRRLASLFRDETSVPISPYVVLILDRQGRPIAAEYEALAPKTAEPTGKGWTWREPGNIWAVPLDTLTTENGDARVIEARKTLGGVVAPKGKSPMDQRLRFRVGENSFNGASVVTGLELELIGPAAPGELRPDARPDTDR